MTGNNNMRMWALSLLLVFIIGNIYAEDKIRLSSEPVNILDGKYVNIPGGKFEMGCNSKRTVCDYSEIPAHTVMIKPFLIDKYEITQYEWQWVMGDYPSYFKGCDNCPVENISWLQIQEFIKNLNMKTGHTYRLPSEAEWEYSCRGGNKSESYCGSNTLDDVAWYIDNSNNKTHPVGQKKPNHYGLYDMTGNVQEWVQDCVHFSYKNAPQDGTSWVSSGDCSQRIYRGGSWNNSGVDMRTTRRTGDTNCCQRNYIGFRLVQDN